MRDGGWGQTVMTPWLRGLGPPGDKDFFVDDNHRHAMWDAAYVLGSLSATDWREFEAHMAGCPACRQAVAELGGIPAMLSRLTVMTSSRSTRPTTHPAHRRCHRGYCRRCLPRRVGAADAPA